jgi:hypothetical protein
LQPRIILQEFEGERTSLAGWGNAIGARKPGARMSAEELFFRLAGACLFPAFPTACELTENVEIGDQSLERARLQTAPYVVFKDLRHG